MADSVARLAVWSGPRNISTALMRAWENRPDSVVVDEPFYAYYLAATGLDHPGRDDVIAAGETDWRRVVDALLGPVPDGVQLVYQKHMNGHLLPEIDRAWIRELTNVLLIRDPREVVASYTKARASVTPDDIGLPQQVQLHEELTEAGVPMPVVDSADFLRSPKTYLHAICEYADVPFTEQMLHWPAGRRDSDGIWAPYWYAAVERSTGFEPYRPRNPDLSGEAAEVAEACLPLYEHLRTHRLQV